jgi:hypothetical protein
MRSYNFAERIMLQHAHPAKLTLDCLGIGLGCHFLWEHRLAWALVSLFGLSILGNIVVWRVDIDRLARTDLGRWMLGQATPVNLVGRSIGATVLACGLWWHSPVSIAGGIAVIVAARLIAAGGRRDG